MDYRPEAGYRRQAAAAAAGPRLKCRHTSDVFMTQSTRHSEL